MAHWLFKTEPTAYSYADLERDKRTVWEGVANAAALIHLRSVSAGDSVVIYHTGDVKSAVGLAEVKRGPYPDPKFGDPKRVVVDLVPVRQLATAVPITAFRADDVLRGSELVRFTRLSVMPLTAEQHARVMQLAAGANVAKRPAAAPPAPVRGRRG